MPRTPKGPSRGQGDVRVASESGLTIEELKPITARSSRASLSGRKSQSRDVLLDALADQELQTTHTFTIAPAKTAARKTARASKRRAHAAVEVDVSPHESAVVLVDQDGEYSWHFPEAKASPARSRAGARKASALSR